MSDISERTRKDILRVANERSTEHVYAIADGIAAYVAQLEARAELAEARLAALTGDTYRDDEGHLCLREMGCVGSIIDHADQLRAEALGCSAEELPERVAATEKEGSET